MKRIVLLIITCLLFTILNAQAPQGINFQAVIRDGSGNIAVNQNVGIRIDIKQGLVTVVYSERFNATTNQYGLVNLVIGQGTPLLGTFNTLSWSTNSYSVELSVDIAGGTDFKPMGTQQLMSVPYALYAEKSGSGGGNADNWGTQTAITNATLQGNGTTASPLSIAPQGATSGQVLKWNGTTWLPSSDLTGGSGGADTPYTAGTGIAISNRVVSNTGDISNTNEIQTLSVSGNNITLSNGGGTIAIPSVTYKINSSNISTYTANSDRIILIEGSITLSSNFNEFCTNNNYIYGGILNGTGQSVCLSNNVYTGTSFNNLSLTGTGTMFINCTFNNLTVLPFNCIMVNCTINNCNLSTATTKIAQMSDSKINGSTIPRIDKIVNSYIYNNSSLGNTTNLVRQVNNCNFNDAFAYVGETFTGNQLYNSSIYIKSSYTSITCIGNAFEGSNSNTNFIDVDATSGSVQSIIIGNNSFRGNTTYPSNAHIKLSGSYSGTRFICKIANNTFVGGTGTCVSNSVSGNASIMVNDNDLLYTGGLGVSTSGFVIVRNNQSH